MSYTSGNIEGELYVTDAFGNKHSFGSVRDISSVVPAPKRETINDIKVGTKIIKLPQKNQAPKKVECKTVSVTVGTKQYTATCMPEDNFDLETGIAIALAKYAYETYSTGFNGLLKDCVKLYKDCEKDRKLEAEEKTRIKHKIEKNAERKAKREAKARQNRVNEMSDAFLSAMYAYDKNMDSKIDTENTQVVALDTMVNDYLTSKGLTTVSKNSVSNLD